MSNNDSTKATTIQQQLTELNDLVSWFQSESFSLEEAFVKYQQAEKLAEAIDHDLMALKNDITVIKQRFDESA